jgi:crotonobetainyl-CoA:carnitine CoA-transferase CaiB-like acyl-CoA transferase
MSAGTSPPGAALEGVLVIALEQAVAAPLCTARLAEAGARVIKIERAEGDLARGYDQVVHGESAYFAWLNRGKESIALDIKASQDAALLHRMLARADVFVQNLLPGAAAHSGILQALFHRERSGEGAGLSVSLFDGLADWMAVPLLHQDYGGKAPQRLGLNHATIAPYGAYPTGDGRQIVIAIQSDREWGAFCKNVLKKPDIGTDPRFQGNVMRCLNRSALDDEIGAVFTSLKREQLVKRLRAGGIAYGRVNAVSDLSRHEQLRRISAHSPTGAISLPAPPVRWCDDEPKGRSIPALNEHGSAIRNEFA